LDLGNKISLTLTPYAPHVPFAGKLIAPSAFYDSFDQIHKLARLTVTKPLIGSRVTPSQVTAARLATGIAAAAIGAPGFALLFTPQWLVKYRTRRRVLAGDGEGGE
ncbi:MAG: hypothetical protein RQ748_12170, partial [Elusimicrobiales bacterium]|nr:hypothetical protein [Elusimicrobiales bacterium]